MNILFVCTGNTCRSVMAEFMMKKKLKERFSDQKLENIKIDSAGIMADEVSIISSNAKKVLEYFYEDIEIYNRKCKLFDENMLGNYDIILTVTNKHKKFILSKFGGNIDKIYTISEFVDLDEDIVDPFMGDFDTYKLTFDKLDLFLDKILDKLF